MNQGLTYARFQTTRWTDIVGLEVKSDSDRREIVNTLATRYWPPVYAHLRCQGLGPAKAADLTQEFFSTVVLGRRLFERARKDRGRLRNLILTALRNLRVDDDRKERKHRASSSIILRDLHAEESGVRSMLESQQPSGTAFDRRWALSLLCEAIERCRRHFCANGRSGHWRLFEQRVLNPATSGNQPPPVSQLYQAAGIASPALAVAAVQVVKKRLAALLEEVVRETVDDDGFDEELAFVRSLIEGGASHG